MTIVTRCYNVDCPEQSSNNECNMVNINISKDGKCMHSNCT